MLAVITASQFVLTDDDLERLSRDNPGWRFERADDGSLLVSSPTTTDCGGKELEAGVQLAMFAKKAGGKAYSAATGFKTPSGGVVIPDASWVREEIVAAHRGEPSFWQIMPDVVIEVASPTDAWPTVVAKIDKYLVDGVRYAIAIDPATRAVYERGAKPAGLSLDVDAIIDA